MTYPFHPLHGREFPLVEIASVMGVRKAERTSGSCRIKGNISYNSGKRIYHMPGDRDYARTKISPARGERWFCSEAEARAAGWRRAGR